MAMRPLNRRTINLDNYASLPTFAKWVLTLDLLLGRLEIHPVIILLVSRFWKK
jgi:trk system potassium uptake protein TrkH